MNKTIAMLAAGLLLGYGPATMSTPPDASAYQITVDHAGVTTSGGSLVLQETPLWSVQLSAPISYPLITSEGVFVTTSTVGGFGAPVNQLYGFNAQTGAQLWPPIVLGGACGFAAAAYDGGTLFVVNSDGVLASYDAATGAAGWSVQLATSCAVSTAPVASNGVVYTAASSASLYAVNETNGATLWLGNVGGGDGSSPALSGTGIYVTYPCAAYDLNPTTGAQIWSYLGGCSGGGGSTPVYAAGNVYARGLVSVPDTIFNAANGTMLGNFAAGPIPAIGSTTGFFLNNGTLAAVDLATNSTTWSFTGDGGLLSPPIVVDQTVIVGSTSSNLYGLDTQSGRPTWQISTGVPVNGANVSGGAPVAGMAIAHGILVVPVASVTGGTLLAYGIFGPPSPASLSATAAAGAIQLSWGAASGAATYNVYMGNAAGQESLTAVQTGVKTTSTLVTSLTPGTSYYFVVRAVGPAGISGLSNEASAIPTTPRPATNLQAKAGIGSAVLSWTASPDATSYNVYQGTSAGGEGTTPVFVGTGTSATIHGLVPGTTYYFVVKAIAYSASSVASNEAQVVPMAPAGPTSLTAVSGSGQVTLTWSAVSGASSYQVYAGTTAGGEAATPIQSGLAGLSTIVTGLTNGTTYFFVVRALTGNGLSSPSNEASATPAAPPPTGGGGSGGGGGGGGGLTGLDLAALLGLIAYGLKRKHRSVPRHVH